MGGDAIDFLAGLISKNEAITFERWSREAAPRGKTILIFYYRVVFEGVCKVKANIGTGGQ
jgi:hypothetical protein